jgi:acylphosphatase
MAKKKCFAFTVKDKVQDVGLRLAIAKQIPDELDVRTDNLPDGSVRVVVRGLEKDVVKFWKAIQRQVFGKAKNPMFSAPDVTSSMPMHTDRFFHKLQCEQMEKFVDVGLGMRDSIDGIGGRINCIGVKIDCMNGKIDNMTSKLDALPRNMAREMVKLRKNGFL